MALRVLLADESSTIKKVMQLALSDFAVEVKAVPVGLDVLTVTKDFKPDIIFADVLLTKRSGYDVCADLKADPLTTHVPVVLMWSGFMKIDEARATSCQANRRLEKPFDADFLRSLVNDLVPKTKSNPVSSFLSFPEMPEFEEEKAQVQKSQNGADESFDHSDQFNSFQPESSNYSEDLNDDFLNIPEVDADDELQAGAPGEEFASVPLTSPRRNDDAEEEGGWAHQDLAKFKIQINEDEPEDFASKFVIPTGNLAAGDVDQDDQYEEVGYADEPSQTTDLAQPRQQQQPPPQQKAPQAPPLVARAEKSVKEQMLHTLQKGVNAQPNSQSKVDLDPIMMEKIIREEAREVIENICWKLLPEIAERIVREELNKILRDTEKSI